MPTDVAAPRAHQPRAIRLRRSLLTCVAGLACLLAVVPAAHAHEDDEMPSTEHVFWGAFFFLLTLFWVTTMSYSISRTGRKSRFPVRRNHPLLSRLLTSRLLRWIAWNPRRRPPRNASRQVRRAFNRRQR